MSPETSLNRRRSRSTSGSPSSLPDNTYHDAWPLSTKRTCPSSPGCVSYPPKWKDVDMWRRGKRSRRSTSPTYESQHFSPLKHSLSHEDTSSASTSSAEPAPHFATTSAEFDLFPKRHNTQKIGPRLPHPKSDLTSLPTDNIDLRNNIDLTRLRSDAFWELRRSIAESGEGLIRRMRDYESSRSRAGVYSKAKDSLRRERKRHSISTRPRRTIAVEDGSDAEEDEIHILSGQGSSDVDFGSPTRKKRAFSVGMADTHISSSSFMGLQGSGERCFSPTTTFCSGPSAYTSDDEESMDLVDDSPLSMSVGPSSSSSPATPALTRSFTTSTNSSFASLPLHFFGVPPPAWHNQHQVIIPASPSSSRSEKAIAALSLAMANGAGGINDYEALRAIETAPIVEDTQVGELWH